LASHESFVTSTADVKDHLDEMTALIETLLQGRDYWVLVEQQFMDSDARSGLYFNIQLQMLIEMYYMQKGRAVKTIHATKRYPFLGIHTWKTCCPTVSVTHSWQVHQLVCGDKAGFTTRSSSMCDQ
jgi:hypothetical protein